MCQLFGLNSARPIIPNFLLRGFFCRGGKTSDHEDGWGVGYYREYKPHLKVRKSSAYLCKDAQRFLKNELLTSNLVAHVRKATVGNIDQINSHPFARQLWGCTWIFAHNGDLKQFSPHVLDEYQPIGHTDSETAFAYLMTRLYQRFGNTSPDITSLTEEIRQFAEEVSQYGTFNFILLVGDLMFVHGTTDLYWMHQQGAVRRLRLVDYDEWVDTSHWHSASDSSVVVATHPITDATNWKRFEKNELKVFSKGQVIKTEALNRSLFDFTSSEQIGYYDNALSA